MSIRFAIRRRFLEFAGVVLAALLLAWTLRDVSWNAVGNVLNTADPAWLAAAVAFAILPFPARILRWRVVLGLPSSSGPFRSLWHATLVGFMANNLLPARLGEWIRAVLMCRLTGLPLPRVIASIVVLRVMDAGALLGILAIAIADGTLTELEMAPEGRSLEAALATVGLALLSLCVAMALLVHAPEALRRRTGALLLRLTPRSLRARAREVARRTLEGLSVLRHPRSFATALGWTVAIWTVNALVFLAGARALAINLSPQRALATQSVVGFGISVVPTPGFFGAFEASVRLTLDRWGIEPALAVTYAIAVHLCFYAPVTVLGLVSLAVLRIRPRELWKDAASLSRR